MKNKTLAIILIMFMFGCGGESGSSSSSTVTLDDYSAATITSLGCDIDYFNIETTDRPVCSIDYTNGTYPVSKLIISEPLQDIDTTTELNLDLDGFFDFDLIFDEELLASYEESGMHRIWLKSPLGIYTYSVWLEDDLGLPSEIKTIQIQANNDHILDNYTSDLVSENMVLNSYYVSTEAIVADGGTIDVDYFINFSSFSTNNYSGDPHGIVETYFFDACTNTHLFTEEGGGYANPLSSEYKYYKPIKYDTFDLYNRLIKAGTLEDCYDEVNKEYKIRLDIKVLSAERELWSNTLKNEYFTLNRF